MSVQPTPERGPQGPQLSQQEQLIMDEVNEIRAEVQSAIAELQGLDSRLASISERIGSTATSQSAEAGEAADVVAISRPRRRAAAASGPATTQVHGPTGAAASTSDGGNGRGREGFLRRNYKKVIVGVAAVALTVGLVKGCDGETNTEKVSGFGEVSAAFDWQSIAAASAAAGDQGGGKKTMKERILSADSVPQAVKAADIDNKKELAEATEIVTEAKNFDPELNNINRKANAHDSDLNRLERMFAVRAAVASDHKEGDAYADATVDAANGKRASHDNGLSKKQTEARAMDLLTGAGTTKNETVTNPYDNTLMHDGGKVEQFGQNADIPVQVRHDASTGKTLKLKVYRDKDGKICFNQIIEGEETAPQTAPDSPVDSPNPGTPGDNPGDNPNPGTPGDNPVDQPESETPGDDSEKPEKPEREEETKEKTPREVIHQSVPGAPGSGGSPEEGMDPENDSNEHGYGPGDTHAVHTGPNLHPAQPVIEGPATPVEVVPVTPEPPVVPPAQTGGPAEPTS